RLVPADLLLGERLRERVPERRVAAGRELLADRLAERFEIGVAAETGGGRVGLQRRLDPPQGRRRLPNPPAKLLRARLRHCPPAYPATPRVGRADEHDRHLFVLQSVLDERRVRRVDERLCGLLLTGLVARVGRLLVELLLQAGDLVLEQVSF